MRFLGPEPEGAEAVSCESTERGFDPSRAASLASSSSTYLMRERERENWARRRVSDGTV